MDEWPHLRLAVARESSVAPGWPAAGISVFKGGDAAPLERARVLLRVILPHLKRALALFFRAQKLAEERNALKTCLDELSDAVFVVDASAQILDRNRAAIHYLNGDYGISEDAGRLRLNADADNVAFRTNLKRATSGSRGLRGKELESGCTLWVHGVGSSHALVFVTKAGTPRAIAPQLLRDALGITPAQGAGHVFLYVGTHPRRHCRQTRSQRSHGSITPKTGPNQDWSPSSSISCPGGSQLYSARWRRELNMTLPKRAIVSGFQFGKRPKGSRFGRNPVDPCKWLPYKDQPAQAPQEPESLLAHSGYKVICVTFHENVAERRPPRTRDLRRRCRTFRRVFRSAQSHA